MKHLTRILLGACAALLGAQAGAQVTFYEGGDFHGRAFGTDRNESDLRKEGFNDRASSVIVDRGMWEVCEDPGYRGRCVLLREGSYDSLKRMRINNEISSARRVDKADGYRGYQPEPLPAPTYEYRQRPDERVYEAQVTSVRAVVSDSGQQCWIEREKVKDKGGRSVGGAVIGGVIGGVIGHQIGSGTGQDIATAGGAVAGAAIGSNAGRDNDVRIRSVQRCEKVEDASPEYWDVTYRFRDVEHHVQMSAPPGRSIYVNERGEPRQ
jgi:uncharacterized protein YcfJ